MTIEEAIKYLRMATDEAGSEEFSDEYKEMCRMSIKALEKQIPKQPKYQGEHEKCPSCGSFYIEDYCAMCGQKIDRD